jgi:Peptidase S46/Tannase and feruloyl esterase
MSMRRMCIGLICAGALGAGVLPQAYGEEGMWTFDNPPLKALASKYGFTPTQAWLDHLRLASVRLNDGGSGSFVSENGLLLTNHHVARFELQKNSTAEHDYLRDGFYAASEDQEMKSPDLEINVLVGMKDVTERVGNAAKGIADPAQALKRRQAEIAEIEKESKDATGLRSDVVSLYNDSEYWLYQYKAYTDVRLVFAPEEQAAFFGGDPDNFTYPRYDLDMALYRVYENGKPLHTENYLKWNTKGATPGDLVFVSGNPGSTSRQEPMSELLFERDVVEPDLLEYVERRIDAEQDFAKQGAQQAERVESSIFFLQNDVKAIQGEHDALLDKEVVAKKKAEEDDLRAKVAANPEWQKEYGSAWDTIAQILAPVKPDFEKRFFRRTDSQLFEIALEIVQYVAEVKKPDGERLPPYHEAGLSSLEFQMLSPAPIYPEVEKLDMTTMLKLAAEKLGAQDEFIQAITQGNGIDKATNALVDGTKLADPAVRKALLDGGEAAVNASTDPMIEAARRVDPIVRAEYLHHRDQVTSVLTPAEEKIGKARFAVYGKNAYPDATFTLRLSYGTVEGYPYNGTEAPPFTTFYGLYDRAASFSNKHPWDLTPKEAAALGKLDLATPMDFVCSDDITGGNSGSPVVDRNGDLVGLIFDGNIESLAGDFVFDETKNRAVAVHAAAMMEALRKIYGANALADEIEGNTPVNSAMSQQADPCASLADFKAPGVEISKAASIAAGSTATVPFSAPPQSVALPAYCRVEGVINRRTGVGGEEFGINFALAMPDQWNGDFLMQGGAGGNGIVYPPIGLTASGGTPALMRGYAVVSTDTGHKSHDGAFDFSFARDQQAYLDFAYQANVEVAALAKQIIAQHYGKSAAYSYFAGCSTGGREGMVLSQRDPTEFDGIVVGDPAMRTSFSNLAIGEWIPAAFNQIAPPDANGKPIIEQAISDDDRKLIIDALMKECDAKDGLADGMISDPLACHFDPESLACKPGHTASCLAPEKAAAIKKAFDGPRTSRGVQVYPGFLYDSGIAATSGIKGILVPGPGLFGPLPTATEVDVDSEALKDVQPLVDSTATNLSTFSARGGKLIFFHGDSDPWFSPLDTFDYYKKMAAANGGFDAVSKWSQFYFVPGMSHCGGGPALDHFDLLGAVSNWVEKGVVPESVMATGKAFPGRSRPLCPYPKHAQYKGQGNTEDASNFECR